MDWLGLGETLRRALCSKRDLEQVWEEAERARGEGGRLEHGPEELPRVN